MKPKHNDRFDRLESLDALGAIKAWLAGDVGYGEENALMLAIRRDTGIDLSDSEIKEIFCEAIEDEREPMHVLQQLIRADCSSEGISPSSLRPR
jgi:hypothetical protein